MKKNLPKIQPGQKRIQSGSSVDNFRLWRTCFDYGDELELKPEILSSIYLPASESVFHALNIIQHVDGCS